MKSLSSLLAASAFAISSAHAANIYNPVLTPLAGPECSGPGRIVAAAEDYSTYPWNHFAVISANIGHPYSPTNLDAGALTGFHASSSAYQLGYAPQGTLRPSVIYQLECGSGGFLIDTAAAEPQQRVPFCNIPVPPEFPYTSPGGNYGINWKIPSWVQLAPKDQCVLSYFGQNGRFTSDAPEIRPWATTTGNPDLVIEFSAKLPYSETTAYPNQFNIDFYLLDTQSGQFFPYVIGVYATGATNPGGGSASVDDQGFPFVSTSLPADGSNSYGLEFFNRSPVSRGFSNTPWSDLRLFRVHVGREHIIHAIDVINQQITAMNSAHAGQPNYPLPLLSTDPANYLLTSAGLLQEQPSPGFMVSSFYDYKLYIATDPAGPPPGQVGTPTALSPSGATTTTPTFSWTAAPNATQYELYIQNPNGVSYDLSFTAANVGCSSSSTCTYTPVWALEPGTTYNWVVRGMTQSQVGAWSNTLTFTTDYTMTNYALASMGGTAYASSENSADFPASAAIDGVRTGEGLGAGGVWADASYNSWGDYLYVALSQPRTLKRVVVYTLKDDWQSPTEPTDTTTFTSYGITDYTVYVMSGGSWVQVGSASGNNLVKRTFDFAPINATAVMVQIWNGHYFSYITELEAFGN